jgi:transposase
MIPAGTLVAGLTGGYVIGDRAYDAASPRKQLREQGCRVVIPPKPTRPIQRRYDRVLHKLSHRIENFFQRFKRFRRIATRYDALAGNSFGTVAIEATQQFTAVARDQFANSLATQPTFTWSVSGGGSISPSGLFTTGSTGGGPYTVTAQAGGLSGTASVTVAAQPTTVYQINTGSNSAASPFAADQYGGGGTLRTVTNTITISGITDPAPQAVYRSERYGNSTYTFS